MSEHYVVYWETEFRDGREDGAKIVPSLAEAEKVINSIGNGFDRDNTRLRLFMLGPEIPLTREIVEQPQPSLKSNRYSATVKVGRF